MSMNTPLGQFTSISTKNIKDFETVQGFGSAQYILGVADEISGTGIKTTLDDFAVSIINAKGSPAITNYSNDITYNEGQWVLDNGVIYKSLTDNNMGNPVTDTNYWQKVQLGGGSSAGGLEIGDISTALYIDESKGLRRYLNGSILTINDNTQAFLDRLKEIRTLNPEYFTDEATWQTEATLNVDGCVYKFVIDETAGTIRLPKYPEYVEINDELVPVAGTGMVLGLTNGVKNYGLSCQTVQGGQPFYATEGTYGLPVSSTRQSTTGAIGIADYGVTTDATKSGIEANLSQTKLKLRYFIQIASGQDTHAEIINNIKLNNPYSLGDSKYSPQELNNLSWLKSAGQWNSKAVYTSFYNNFSTKIGEGFGLGFVKESTDSYDDYDLVINTSDETFRLPLFDGSESLVGETRENLTLLATGSTYIASHNGIVSVNKSAGDTSSRALAIVNLTSGQSTEQGIQCGTNSSGQANAIMRTCLSVKKGDEFSVKYTSTGTVNAFSLVYAKGNGSLYYYVGETVQNANLIDAGRIEEVIVTKVDTNADNFTATGKANITSLAIPDYTNRKAGVSGYNIWKTVDCDTWVTAAATTNQYYGTLGIVLKDTDGNELPGCFDTNYKFFDRCSAGYANGLDNVALIVPKGFSYMINHDNATSWYSCWEFPLKGAN